MSVYPRPCENGAGPKPTVPDETGILERAVRHHDKHALAILYIKHVSHIKQYIALRIGHVADVDDLAEQVFVEICRGAARYDGRGNVQAYLQGIARKVLHSYFRRKARATKVIPTGSITQYDALCEARSHRGEVRRPSRGEFNKMVQGFKAVLPPKAYEALRGKFIEGLCARDAARKLGCSVDAFRKRLQRAVKILQCKIGEKGG
jgi:RNA polymerase sigma-70 factor (ECF subfamily)